MANLFDLIKEDEEKRIAAIRAEMAAEKAAWDALTPEQKAAYTAAVEAKFANVPDCDDDHCSHCGEDDCDGECIQDQDDGEFE